MADFLSSVATFALKIRFLKTTYCVSWIDTSASISFVRS